MSKTPDTNILLIGQLDPKDKNHHTRTICTACGAPFRYLAECVKPRQLLAYWCLKCDTIKEGAA